MMENKEIWKDCKGYEGLYQVSNLGRVWSVRKQRCIKPWKDSRGYLTLELVALNGKRKTEKVHRLVAIAFIENPNGLPQVNHKDENKENACVDNLEWCDAKYNCNYGTRNKKIIGAQNKFIYCVELNRVFSSIKEAQEQLGIKGHHIGEVCEGKRKTCDGYHWEYYDGSNKSESEKIAI